MENLGIDIRLLIAQLTNFIIFFLIFKKFLAVPFSKFILTAKQKEKEKIEIDKRMQELNKLEQEIEKKVREQMNNERNELIRKTKEENEKIRNELIKKTENEIILMKKKAKEKLLKEQKLQQENIRKEVIDLSFYLIEIGLKEVLSPQLQKELTNYILKNSKKIN